MRVWRHLALQNSDLNHKHIIVVEDSCRPKIARSCSKRPRAKRHDSTGVNSLLTSRATGRPLSWEWNLSEDSTATPNGVAESGLNYKHLGCCLINDINNNLGKFKYCTNISNISRKSPHEFVTGFWHNASLQKGTTTAVLRTPGQGQPWSTTVQTFDDSDTTSNRPDKGPTPSHKWSETGTSYIYNYIYIYHHILQTSCSRVESKHYIAVATCC